MARPPISPVRWQPPTAPARSRRSHSARPLPPLRLLDIVGKGPEDVLVDDAGQCSPGGRRRILRLAPNNRLIEVLGGTGGRPLGLEEAPRRRATGLRRPPRSASGRPRHGHGGHAGVRGGWPAPIYCNNAAVAADGTVYFSDSSQRSGRRMEGRPARTFWHRSAGSRASLRRSPCWPTGCKFANGVALAPDGSFVVAAETAAYRLRKVWITGPRAGEAEVFVDNLPGFPDNVSTGTDGLFWVALSTPRDRMWDWLLPRHPRLRQVVWVLPDGLQPPTCLTRYGCTRYRPPVRWCTTCKARAIASTW
jgi:sugar lactone lactonase YvrE